MITHGKVRRPAQRVWKALCVFVALLPVLSLTGCSDPNVGIVSGTITVNGEPAQTGSIAFIPVDGQSSTAGAAISDGQYTATVPVGQAKVQLRVSKVVGQQKLYDTPDSPVAPIWAEVLPPKYNDQTELLLDVQPGENQQDYDLTTK